MLEVLIDAFLIRKMVPFLFGAFTFWNFLNTVMEDAILIKLDVLVRNGRLGVLPEWGPPILAANLFQEALLLWERWFRCSPRRTNCYHCLGETRASQDVVRIVITKLLIAVMPVMPWICFTGSLPAAVHKNETFEHHKAPFLQYLGMRLNHHGEYLDHLFIFNALFEYGSGNDWDTGVIRSILKVHLSSPCLPRLLV